VQTHNIGVHTLITNILTTSDGYFYDILTHVMHNFRTAFVQSKHLHLHH